MHMNRIPFSPKLPANGNVRLAIAPFVAEYAHEKYNKLFINNKKHFKIRKKLC